MRAAPLVACALGALALVLVAIGEPAVAARAWLWAWTVAVTTSLGAVGILLLADVAPIGWFAAFRPAAEALVAPLPALGLGLVPLLAAHATLWPGASIVGVAARSVVTIGGAWVLTAPWGRRTPSGVVRGRRERCAARRDTTSRQAPNPPPEVAPGRRDREGDAGPHGEEAEARSDDVPRGRGRPARAEARSATREEQPPTARPLAAPGLLFLLFAWSASSVDWVMATTPGFTSTVYGILVPAGGLAAALAATLVATREPALPPDTWHAAGRLLLAGVCVWAYLQFSQLLIVWSAAKPEELAWYVPRQGILAGGMVAAHFVVPFVALLSRRLKRSPPALAAVAWVVLAGHAVDLGWQLLPPARPLALVAAAALAAGLLLVPRPGPAPDLAPSLRYRSP